MQMFCYDYQIREIRQLWIAVSTVVYCSSGSLFVLKPSLLSLAHSGVHVLGASIYSAVCRVPRQMDLMCAVRLPAQSTFACATNTPPATTHQSPVLLRGMVGDGGGG